MIKSAGRSLFLIKIAGIPIKVHWTFGLLVLFVAYVAFDEGLTGYQALAFFSYVLILFAFVIMHEYGHALTARRFGVATRDIIISPIGGVARLERMPAKASQELWVALAGPMVNVVLAMLFIAAYLIAFGQKMPELAGGIVLNSASGYLANLIYINIALVVFNMVPAFPMDGGRVLRSLLSMGLKNRLKATKWASIIGQIFAVIFVIGGIYMDHFVIIFIGIFVFVTAGQEFRQVFLEEQLNNTHIKDIMRRAFTRIRPGQILEDLSINNERNFLVYDEENQIIGSLPWLHIKEAQESQKVGQTVGQILSPSYGVLFENTNVFTAYNVLNQYGWSIAPVVDPTTKEVRGVIDRDIISQFLASNSKKRLWF